jgi:hypothetical protein
MENTLKNITPTFTDIVKTDIISTKLDSPTPELSSLSSSSDGSSSSSSNWFIILIIILILAFLGINIFSYLAKGTQSLSEVLTKLLGFFGITTKQIVEVSGEGTKGAIDVTSQTAKGLVTGVQKTAEILPPKRKQEEGEDMTNTNLQGVNTRFNEDDASDKNKLSVALSGANRDARGSYEADDSYSSIQGGGKSGWCFIGEANGVRTCGQVGENDKCMSGNIFPSQEICVNPNLRM